MLLHTASSCRAIKHAQSSSISSSSESSRASMASLMYCDACLPLADAYNITSLESYLRIKVQRSSKGAHTVCSSSKALETLSEQEEYVGLLWRQIL
ncbi:hypothetical protein KCU85_g421, partial [Aureobasidium melanogenum]